MCAVLADGKLIIRHSRAGDTAKLTYFAMSVTLRSRMSRNVMRIAIKTSAPAATERITVS